MNPRVQYAVQKAVDAMTPNWLDKAINWVDPIKGAKRLQARQTTALYGQWNGASKTRRAVKEWTPTVGDADTDTLDDLPTLRDRSRDLLRNSPLAVGAINTKCTNIIGTGLKLQSRIDRDALNLTDEQADAWESQVEREWRLWSQCSDCDAERTLNFDSLQALALRSTLEAGDVFILLPSIKRKNNPYQLAVQLIEADRICNENFALDTPQLAGGIKKDQYGAPVEYQVLRGHPGNIYSSDTTWTKIPAYGSRSGRRIVLHLYNKRRVSQSRGVPDLAPVMETLKQLDRYTEAEIMAAVISSFFTVFIKTEDGDSGAVDPTGIGDEVGAKSSDKDFKMASGAILDLAEGESIETANPGRPNTAFDPFVQSILRQVGVALEIPFEILIGHFTASYSAARAAMLTAWKFFSARRKWMADNFCQPIYEEWLTEAVLSGRIAAPGFLNDPAIRKAYCHAEWIGPARGAIDEKKEADGAMRMIEIGAKTRAEVTAEMSGGDWESKHRQQVKEENRRKADGLPTIGEQTGAVMEAEIVE